MTLSVHVPDVARLLESAQPPCVSIYLTTRSVRPGGPEDRIHLKNVLREAEQAVRSRCSPRIADELLRPLVERVRRPWPPRSRSLVLLRSRDAEAEYGLPFAMPEILHVGDTFQVAPLVRWAEPPRHFYVLALSEKSIRLFEGSAFSLIEIELESLPGRVGEAMGDPRAIERHAGLGGDCPSSAARKRRLGALFRIVDRAVCEYLRGDDPPVVLAGVGYLHAIYRNVSRYPRLVRRGILGSIEHLGNGEVHARAWPLVACDDSAEPAAIAAEYRSAAARGAVTDRLGEVSRAAVEGRVLRLFCRQGERLLGRLDPANGACELHGEAPADGAVDILDRLRALALERGAAVCELQPHDMPSDSPVAAILRS